MTDRIPDNLSFYATHEQECSYLPRRRSVTLFADPTANMDTPTYGHLARLGFRRSGAHVYRPACKRCRDCVPIRIPVTAFRPRQSQKRVLKRNHDLSLNISLPDDDPEHFDLYLRYQKSRHPGGGMDNDDPNRYLDFLDSDWSDSRLLDFRLDDKLIGVAVIDMLEDGMSAVYTYFDPDHSRRSLGSLAVLWQVEWARMMNLPYVYLGYWIQDSDKMNYKTGYLPYELLLDGDWQRFDKDLMQALRETPSVD